MEDATPIFQLKENVGNEYASDRKAPLDVMSYSDVLKKMQSDEISQQQKQPVQQIQQPVQQIQQPVQQVPYEQRMPISPEPASFATFRGLNTSNIEEPVENLSKSKTTEFDNTFQNEMIILLLVYVFVHMSQVQTWLQTKVPNIINSSTGNMSVLGLLMNGVAVIVLWNLSKRVIVRYMKDL